MTGCRDLFRTLRNTDGLFFLFFIRILRFKLCKLGMLFCGEILIENKFFSRGDFLLVAHGMRIHLFCNVKYITSAVDRCVRMKLERTSILLLIAVSLAGFMDGLDGSIVNIALPVIARGFGTDTGTVSWVALAYLMMVAGTIFIFGNIAARGHMKKIFILGFSLFTAASLFCGLSSSLPILIAARVFQGLGASMIVACAPIICVKYLPINILGFSLGLLTALSSVAYALGPALGGIITHYLSWNWIFWINIPIGIFAIIFILKVLPKDAAPVTDKFDFRGAALLFFAMISGVYAIERLPHLGFTDPQILICLGAALVALGLFCIAELKSEKPLINIRVFKLFSVNAVVISFLILQVIYCGFFYLLPFFLSNALNMDTLVSGLLLLIPAAVTGILSVPVSRWSDRTGRRWFCVVVMVLLTIIGVIYAFMSPTWNIGILILTLTLMGIDFGIASGPAASRIIETMPDSEREMGSTLMMTCLYLGAVLGTALFAALFTLFTAIDNTAVSFADLPTDLFMTGFNRTMMVAAVISVVAVILAFVVKDRKRVL